MAPPAMLTCNKWVGTRKWQAWQLTGEGGNREEERKGGGVCLFRGVCVWEQRETKRDKARQSVGKRDGNSLRTDKEGAWEDDGETMEEALWVGRRETIPWPEVETLSLLPLVLFMLITPTLPTFFFSSEVTLQSSRNMAAPLAGFKGT